MILIVILIIGLLSAVAQEWAATRSELRLRRRRPAIGGDRAVSGAGA
jgi:hypothetical protein